MRLHVILQFFKIFALLVAHFFEFVSESIDVDVTIHKIEFVDKFINVWNYNPMMEIRKCRSVQQMSHERT